MGMSWLVFRLAILAFFLQLHASKIDGDHIYGEAIPIKYGAAQEENTFLIFTKLTGPSGDLPVDIAGHSAVSSDSNQMLIFGGYTPEFEELNDARSWDPTTNTWTLARPSGNLPLAREGHSTSWYNGKMYMFGGWSLGQRQNDIWEFEPPNIWRRLYGTGNAPIPRYGHAAWVMGKELHIFGGWKSEGVTNELYIFDLERHAWDGPFASQVPPMYGHSATVVGDRVVIYGGYSLVELSNDVYIYNYKIKAWDGPVACSGPTPQPRLLHVAFYWQGLVIVHGGLDEDWEMMSDMAAFDIEAYTWETRKIRNRLALAGHTAIVMEDKVYLYGGGNGVTEVVEIHKNEVQNIKYKTEL